MRRVLLVLCGLALLAAAPPAARAVPAREPVIVIPGIAGSEFVAQRAFHLNVPDGHGGVYDHDYPAGEKVWVNVFQVALPGGDDYFDALKLQPDGRTPAAPDLAVSGLYESTYGDLVGYLERQGYALGRDLFLFPYDWRRDLRDTADLLDAQVTRALVAANGGESDPARWSVRQVDLVAHSMGGVLGRLYVSDAARARRVDQLITFGSPQLGAPKLLKTALYGDDFGTTTLGLGLSPAEVKDLVQNMPGALGLLPSRSYYALYDNDDAAHLSPLVEDRDLDGDGVIGGALGPDAVRALLPKLELNRAVLDIASALQGQLDGRRTYLPLVDGLGAGELSPPHTVRWQALVGFGSPSIGQIREYTGLCGAEPCPKHDELPVDGDGTVPLFSAALGDPARGRLITDAAQRWYVERGHTALVQRDYLLGVPTGDGPALEWLGARLAEQPDLAIQGIQAAPLPGLSGLQIAALGPAALRATDPSGQSVGRAPGAEPAPPAWPGASYDRLPNGEFVFLKSWRDGATVELGAERAGAADLKLRLFQHGQIAATAVYLGLRLGPASRVAFDLPPGDPASPGGWPDLRIDADGDGVFESRQAATALLGPGESGDTTPPAITLAPVGSEGAGPATPRWSVSDAGAGLLRVLTALDGAPARLSGASGALGAPGHHTLRVVAVDRAGNASSREFTWSAP